MALKFVSTNKGSGSGGGTYDHNLLVNRGLPDQHTIESITGLRTLLNRKYEKPFTGIPKNDLGFDVATLYDIEVFKQTEFTDVRNDLLSIVQEVYEARGGLERLREYIDTKVPYSDYSGGGTGGGHLPSQVGYPIYESFKVLNDGEIDFVLSKSYQMGTHQLEVYLDGLRMIQDDDYKEIDDQTIQFLFPLEKDSIVLCMVRAIINSGLHEEHVAIEGQTVFTLSNPYGIHQHILQIFRNGVLQTKGRHYRELDSFTVEFMYPLKKDDIIIFHQAGSTDPVTGTILESEIGRMKMNNAYTTLMILEATNSSNTDFMNMYVDHFVTNQNIDAEQSFQYEIDERSIIVTTNIQTASTEEDFEKGLPSMVDIYTYPNTITLSNVDGGSDSHAFQPKAALTTTGHFVEDHFVMTTNRFHYCTIYSEDIGTERVLFAYIEKRNENHEVTQHIIEITRTNGHFFGLNGRQDKEGNIHFVCHEQEGLTEARILYTILNMDLLLSTVLVISDPSFDSITPKLALDKDDTAHIVFASKRVNPTYFNIDYVSIRKDMTRSGFKNITLSSMYHSLNPSIEIGADEKIRFIFESNAYDPSYKNIELIVFENDTQVYHKHITASKLFDNVMPVTSISYNDQLKIAWRSKRMDTTQFGIDYCSLDSSFVTAGLVDVASGIRCGVPSISVDYEGITHIVFHANLTRNDHENICYKFIYPTNTPSILYDIASELNEHYTEPVIHAYGNRLECTFVSNMDVFRVAKSLSNYTTIGRYDYVFDSRASNTEWKSISSVHYIPIDTSLKYEYRISNDQIVWTEWKERHSLQTEAAKGRYLQLRLTLETTTVDETPIVYSIDVSYIPNFIEIQSIPKESASEIDAVMIVAKYEGDVTFQVSRDGIVFSDALVNQSTHLVGAVSKEVIIRAKIANGSRLQAWGIVW